MPRYSCKSIFWVHGPRLVGRSGRTFSDFRGTPKWLQLMMHPILEHNPAVLSGLTIVDNRGRPVSWETIVNLNPTSNSRGV